MMRFTITILATLLMLLAGGGKASAEAVYAAATWSDTSVHLLDAGLNDLSSFSAGASSPNGVTSDGTLIYSGHFGTQEVIAYDFAGAEQFRWSSLVLGYLQGMTFVGSELATMDYSNIYFHNPTTGAINHNIPNVGGLYTEGMTYDGSLLWLLTDNNVLGVNPADGSVASTIANAASGEAYGGTGIALGAPGELILAGTSGNWWRVSSSDGSVSSSGNNALNMYGLTHLQPIPAPSVLVGLLSMGAMGLVVVWRRKKATTG